MVVAFVLFLGTTGCGPNERLEDAQKAVVAIKDELGVEARVQFRRFESSASGKHMSVTVSVQEPRTGDVPEFKAKIVAIVGRTFRSKVDRVDVFFFEWPAPGARED